MLSLGYVGRSLPPTTPVTITAEAVGEFTAALGQPDPSPDLAPPTFLISLTLPAADVLVDDPNFGLDFSRVLHREQKFDYIRPVRVGDTLSCVVTVDSIKSVAGNDLLSLRTDVTTDAGEAVACVWTTLFVAASPDDDLASVKES